MTGVFTSTCSTVLLAVPVAKQNGLMGKAIAWHWGAFIYHPLPWASKSCCLKGRELGGSEHRRRPDANKRQHICHRAGACGRALVSAGGKHGLWGLSRSHLLFPPALVPVLGQVCYKSIPFTSQAVRAKPGGYWKTAVRCVILFFFTLMPHLIFHNLGNVLLCQRHPQKLAGSSTADIYVIRLGLWSSYSAR